MQLFLLAGQSNMAGRGALEAQDRVTNPRVVMLDRALRWIPATDPLHFDHPAAGVGPGRTFALTLAAADSAIRIGLIPAAVGGSPMTSWEPSAVDVASGTQPYADAISRARAAMKHGTLKALLWHQGESDANPQSAPAYEQRLRALVLRFRRDLGAPELPVLIGQLGHFAGCPWTAAQAQVNAAQRALPAQLPNVAFVSSEGLNDAGDCVHFDAASARKLGRRYAAAYRLLERK